MKYTVIIEGEEFVIANVNELKQFLSDKLYDTEVGDGIQVVIVKNHR
jgi:hypothetical protein